MPRSSNKDAHLGSPCPSPAGAGVPKWSEKRGSSRLARQSGPSLMAHTHREAEWKEGESG